MIFTETDLPGAYVVDLEPREDERGFFARAWCRDEFAAQGLSTELVQCNISYNRHKGTVRGMHFQNAPHAEIKLVRCTQGAIYDVIIDLRPDSPAHKRWIGVELTAANRRTLYVPKGFAHGFQTLADETETFYQVSDPYAPDSEGGVRFDDPAFGIEWPLGAPTVVSGKDQGWPLYTG